MLSLFQRHSKPSLNIVVLFVASIFASTIASSQNTGLPFLRLGSGAKSIAMGEASVAVASGAASVHYNPALLSFVREREFSFMHKKWISDTRTEQLNAVIPVSPISLGFGINSTNVDGIEIRHQPGASEGTFGLHDFAFSLSASWQHDSTLSIGATAKYLYEKIYIEETDGVAFDVGAVYTITPFLTLGAVLANVGWMGKLYAESPELPSLIRVGGLYRNHIDDDFDASAAMDISKIFKDSDVKVHLGGEIQYNRSIAVRTGYQLGYTARGVTSGLGFSHGIFTIDYAYVPFSEGLGDTHSFSISVRL